jgi:hypothetical protein
MVKKSTRTSLFQVEPLYAILTALFLSACGGGGGGGSTNNNSQGGTGNGTPSSHAVGGTVSGLSGTVSLQNNSGDTLTVATNGSFRFTTPVTAGQSYQVSISSQPANQNCTVTAGSGTMGSADISTVAINCTTTMFAVRGTLSGLTGTLILQNNGNENLTLTQNGEFSFPTMLASGSAYQVTIASQPSNQRCTVTSGTGSIDPSSAPGVTVACHSIVSVGGAISGLTGTLVLQNNASDDLIIATNGAFTFATTVLAGTSYQVTILSQPQNSLCTVTSGNGTAGSTDITNIAVSCQPTVIVTKPARYDAASYSSFTSQNGTGNLEGTWIMLSEGTQSYGYQIAGINPRRDYQLWSRTTVRVRRDPADPAYYFVLTCGPAGAANRRIQLVAGAFPVPYFAASTSTYLGHSVPIIDATTMRRDSVTRTYQFSGNSDGLLTGYHFAWVLKRISDDPFALPATVRDNLSSQSVDATCIHEVEGTYVATENDGTTETSRLEGTFYWTDAYPADPSQLINSSNSYLPRFSLRDENGFNTSYSTNSLAIFTSSIGDQIDVVRNFSGTTSSHSVQATNAQGSADDTLEIPY